MAALVDNSRKRGHGHIDGPVESGRGYNKRSKYDRQPAVNKTAAAAASAAAACFTSYNPYHYYHHSQHPSYCAAPRYYAHPPAQQNGRQGSSSLYQPPAHPPFWPPNLPYIYPDPRSSSPFYCAAPPYAAHPYCAHPSAHSIDSNSSRAHSSRDSARSSESSSSSTHGSRDSARLSESSSSSHTASAASHGPWEKTNLIHQIRVNGVRSTVEKFLDSLNNLSLKDKDVIEGFHLLIDECTRKEYPIHADQLLLKVFRVDPTILTEKDCMSCAKLHDPALLETCVQIGQHRGFQHVINHCIRFAKHLKSIEYYKSAPAPTDCVRQCSFIAMYQEHVTLQQGKDIDSAYTELARSAFDLVMDKNNQAATCNDRSMMLHHWAKSLFERGQWDEARTMLIGQCNRHCLDFNENQYKKIRIAILRIGQRQSLNVKQYLAQFPEDIRRKLMNSGSIRR